MISIIIFQISELMRREFQRGREKSFTFLLKFSGVMTIRTIIERGSL